MRSLVLLCVVCGVAGAGPLRVQDGRFVDGSGGTVILRGYNVAGNSKVPPFRPATPPVFDALPALGVNVVRLLFTWEAYEPTRGAYDASYLDYYLAAVRAAAARDIFVVVDFHQDAYSRASIGGCGEGMPLWSLPPTVTAATPDNGPACADWPRRILADTQLPPTWDAFFADSYGARSAYLAMLTRVAAALAAEPNVIGYDLLNEPGGDEVTQLAPLYEDAAPRVRAADPSAIMFLSPIAVTSAGTTSRLPRPTFANAVFSPHFYDPLNFILGEWSGQQPDDAFAQMSAVSAAWGAPLFLGEYGATPGTGMAAAYVDALVEHLDARLASGTQWVYTPGWTPSAKDGWNTEDFSIVDDSGALRTNARVRPAPQRVAGVPTSLAVSAGGLTLSWQHDPAAGETRVFAPRAYFGGAAPDLSADGDLRCVNEVDRVVCSAASAGPKTLRLDTHKPRCGLTGGEAALLLALLAWSRRQRRKKMST